MREQDKERLKWQAYEQEKPEDSLKLYACPWCEKIPIWIDTNWGFEVHCQHAACNAQPSIGFNKGYTREEVTYAWNSYKTSTAKQKKEIYRDKLSFAAGRDVEYTTPDLIKKENEGARKDFSERFKKEVKK